MGGKADRQKIIMNVKKMLKEADRLIYKGNQAFENKDVSMGASYQIFLEFLIFYI